MILVTNTDHLRELREQIPLSIDAVASGIGVSSAHYYDIECIAGDLALTCTLGEVQKLLQLLDADIAALMRRECDDSVEHNVVSIGSPSELFLFIKKTLDENKMPLEQFETEAGWRIEQALRSPASIWHDWNLQCLADVSQFIGLSWVDTTRKMFRCSKDTG